MNEQNSGFFAELRQCSTVDRIGIGMCIVLVGAFPAAALATVTHLLVMPGWLLGGMAATLCWASAAPDQRGRP